MVDPIRSGPSVDVDLAPGPESLTDSSEFAEFTRSRIWAVLRKRLENALVGNRQRMITLVEGTDLGPDAVDQLRNLRADNRAILRMLNMPNALYEELKQEEQRRSDAANPSERNFDHGPTSRPADASGPESGTWGFTA